MIGLREQDLHRLFRASLWMKGAHSMIEVAGGLLLYVLPHEAITQFVRRLTWAELLEDPRDLVANILRQAAHGFGADAQAFAAWYLFSHGAVKLALVAAIFADRRWAYPLFIAAMGGFIAYQFHLMLLQLSLPLVAITVLDIIVLALAIHEYRFRRRLRAQGAGR
ncbi:MAG TPA: DUF2127 domain-containing protein [Paracoccus sp. (in: a-proteobacteria)]|nr:DUF2127 domain-containing protein [Paracoccus sp. (in: a-proteobacteria)]